MNIRRIILLILLTLIFIVLIVINPFGFNSDQRRSNTAPLNPEHLTEEYEFKDTKVIWRIEEE